MTADLIPSAVGHANGATAQQAKPPLDLVQLRPALQALWDVRATLNREVLERDRLNELLLIAVLAKANMMLFGDPGTGKSYLVDVLLDCIADALSGVAARGWKGAFSLYDVPSLTFGPKNLALLPLGKDEHIIDNTVLDAHIAFYDEYLEAGKPLQNAQLPILNERQFRNGQVLLSIPLWTVVAATNRGVSASDAAHIDRFLIKYFVVRLTPAGRRELRMRDAGLTPPLPPRAHITLAQMEQLQAAVRLVRIPESLIDLLGELDQKLGDGPGGAGIVYSDRRARQVLMLIRAAALLAGKDTADEDDLDVLQYALWQEPGQIETVAKLLGGLVNPINQRAKDLLDVCAATRATVLEAIKGQAEDAQTTLLVTAHKKLNRASKIEMPAILAEARGSGRNTAKIERIATAVEALRVEIFEALTGTGARG